MVTISPDAAFVDTSAWFDYFVPGPPASDLARELIKNSQYPLITSDYVLDELFSLLKARGKYLIHDVVWKTLNDPNSVAIIDTSRKELSAAYSIYAKFSDKDWSFTDCLSYHCIRKMKIRTAFSTDEHFREFGIVNVLPKHR